MANKVIFGLEKVHVGLYTESNGTVTLGTPMHIEGAVNMSLEPDSEETIFWADNVKYYVTYSDNGLTGTLEMALFPDEFKTTFLNYVALANDGIGQVKGVQNKKVYIAFESGGDAEKRRGILYNVSLGHITREYATTEGTNEPKTASLPITVNGDNNTGLTRAYYGPSSSVYDTIFTAPPVPAL